MYINKIHTYQLLNGHYSNYMWPHPCYHDMFQYFMYKFTFIQYTLIPSKNYYTKS